MQDRYHEFSEAMREFNFVTLCQRHNEAPAADLSPGCLATRCPACPQPDINMDPGWEDRPEDEQ